MKKYQRILLDSAEQLGSMRAAAMKAGIPMTSYYAYVTENKLPRLDTLQSLAQVWDVPLASLLLEEGSETDLIDDILHELRKLSIEDKRYVRNLLRRGLHRS